MSMRALRLALVPLGVGLGLAVEWAFYDPALGLALTAADFAVGLLLIGCGAVAWDRRPESRVGGLMALSGLAWFLGDLGGAAVYFHRGPLVHLVLSYPSGRLRGRLAPAVVAAAYADALIEPLARNDALTVALAAAVALAASVEPARLEAGEGEPGFFRGRLSSSCHSRTPRAGEWRTADAGRRLEPCA